MELDTPTASSSKSPLSYLEHQEAAASPELKPLWSTIREAYERKWVADFPIDGLADETSSLEFLSTNRLWHNLTVALSQFVSLPTSGPYQIELFDK